MLTHAEAFTVEDNGLAAICEVDWKVSACYFFMVMDGNGTCMGNRKTIKRTSFSNSSQSCEK